MHHHRLLLLIVLLTEAGSVRIDRLAETDRDSTSISIQWSRDKTADVEASALAEWVGYKIKYMRGKPDDKASVVTLANINQTRHRLDKLAPNTDYRIQISAYKRDGEEGPSSSVLTARTTETGSKGHTVNHICCHASH